jgi:hypothetical protein
VVVVVLLVLEVGVRLISSHLAGKPQGDAAEMEVKRDQIVGLAADGTDIDLVFLGNSMVDAGVNPEAVAGASAQFDDAYNAALIGAPLRSQSAWADRFVLGQLDPEVVVLGVNPLDLLNAEGVLDNRLADVEQGFDDTLEELDPGVLTQVDEQARSVSALVDNRSSLRSPSAVATAVWRTVTGADPVDTPEPQVLAGGVVVDRDADFWRSSTTDRGGATLFHERTLDPTVRTPFLRGMAEAVNTASYHREYADDVLDYLDDEGVQTVMVITPVVVPLLVASGAELDRIDAALEVVLDIADDHDVPVLDFLNARYDPALFADISHLNAAGSTRFSRELAAQLDAAVVSQR